MTVRIWVKRPLNANGSGAVHALRMSSTASAYFARRVPGFALYAYAVSIDVPTGKPAMMRPRDMRSSTAISSATRTGGL